ncbi:Sodium/hydrogen exchanger family-domain-containing protein [Tribonema minus]|uniref:Sodium/hydrogen exchanger n=1 Tax=Tribonema minus TaxID=303371 RepID=A0A835YNG3_9STRA|nr:Sodium/hydrogen exchanger family-domain-containing protein [Tribonema minus]
MRLISLFSITGTSNSQAFVLIFTLMLVVVITVADYLVGHHLNRKLPFHVPESGVTFFIGMLLGGTITLFTQHHEEENPLIKFSPTIFFLAFLPPIIFNEGYHLKQQFFFGYIKEILIFSVVGTGISAIIMAGFIYGQPGDKGAMTFPEAAAFGGLISATDPVAVLAILGQLRVEPALFYLVFGESVLNDAVSLVIFNIASKFIGESYGSTAVWIGFADFIIILLGSCAIGYVVPCITTLLLRRVDLRGHVVLEMSVYLLMAYVPYVLAEIVGQSGIVAILMAGITTRSYAHRNLSSRKTQEFADFFFRLCSFLADNAVFVYMGMTVFGLNDIKHEFNFGFVFWTFFGCLVSRAVVVIVLSKVINVLSSYSNLNPIGKNNQIVLWFAGLRGAVAFAAASNFPDVLGNANAVLTTTVGTIMIFTFVVAPLTMPLIKKLGMPMNVEYETTRPPRMPRLVRWLHAFDERFIDQVLIRKCAQRGGPCEYYHLALDCPSTIYALDGEDGGHGGHGSSAHDSAQPEEGTGGDEFVAPVTPRAASAAPSPPHSPSALDLALNQEHTLKQDLYNYGGAVSPERTRYMLEHADAAGSLSPVVEEDMRGSANVLHAQRHMDEV